MCGINGILSRKPINDIGLRIQRMNDSLCHRGPDAGGHKIWDGNKTAFGQRRLSIIDIDRRSDQPMESPSGNILIYNGEIYNFKGIKRELTDYSFKTESDTEVLLAGIERRGLEWILGRANGMFAFAYYDRQSCSVYMARDRMGIKPLYYYRDDDKIVFSSEIKGILHSGLVKAEFNEDAVDEYLANRYVRAPYTFFENIYQMDPGTFLVIRESAFGMTVESGQYWDLPGSFNTNTEFDEESILNEFGHRVEDAVKKRMLADVTVGTYLSGGVDSSLISAIAAHSSGEAINTYTIGFPELNEFAYARKVADKYGTRHHEILIDASQYFDGLEELIRYKDAPLGVPNEIPLALMSKELKKEITVVLSGEGADELLGGYGRIYRSPYDYRNLGVNRICSFYDYFISLYEYVPREIRDKYLNVGHSFREAMDTAIRREFDNHPNEENVFRFFHKYHVKGLLQRVDTTTMLAGVEARVPFLDHGLIEYSYEKIPYSLKLRWKNPETREGNERVGSSVYSERMDTPKYLLKKMALRYLPEEVVFRKKVGFPVPLNGWIGKLSDEAKEILKDAYWIKADALDSMISECVSQTRGGQIIWMLINVEIFRRIYFEKEWRY